MCVLSGYYCPNGTEYDTQYACPPGTYNMLELGTTLDDCQDCPGGQYCEGTCCFDIPVLDAPNTYSKYVHSHALARHEYINCLFA